MREPIVFKGIFIWNILSLRVIIEPILLFLFMISIIKLSLHLFYQNRIGHFLESCTAPPNASHLHLMVRFNSFVDMLGYSKLSLHL